LSEPSEKPGQLTFHFEHRAALTGDDFVVAPCNSAAVSWLDNWPDWPGPALVIYGPPGCGKTHLTAVFSARAGAVALDPDAPEEQLIATISSKGSAYTADNIDTRFDEQTLFHIYNSVAASGGHILLTSQKSPKQWGPSLPDLSSRLLSSPACSIGVPDEELIKGVLVKLFSDRQLKIEFSVIEYIVLRMERSLNAARVLVEDIDRLSLSEQRNVTLPFVRDILAEKK